MEFFRPTSSHAAACINLKWYFSHVCVGTVSVSAQFYSKKIIHNPCFMTCKQISSAMASLCIVLSSCIYTWVFFSHNSIKLTPETPAENNLCPGILHRFEGHFHCENIEQFQSEDIFATWPQSICQDVSFRSYLLILLRGGIEHPLVHEHLLPDDLPQDLLVLAPQLGERGVRVVEAVEQHLGHLPLLQPRGISKWALFDKGVVYHH